jgi:hypothetical protein
VRQYKGKTVKELGNLVAAQLEHAKCDMGTVPSDVTYTRLVLEVYQVGEKFSEYLSLDYILLHAVCFLAHQWLTVLDVLWQMCGVTQFLSATDEL